MTRTKKAVNKPITHRFCRLSSIYELMLLKLWKCALNIQRHSNHDEDDNVETTFNLMHGHRMDLLRLDHISIFYLIKYSI